MDSTLSKELALPSDCVSFERTRLVFRRVPAWEEWQQVMVYLKAVRHVGLIWLADARLVGRRSFGDEPVAEFEKQLEFELPDLRAAEALAQLESRSERLSAEHHFVVARKVESAEDQGRWLAVAEKEGLTPGELRSSIEAGRVVRAAERQGRSGGIATIEAVRQLFEMWESQAGDWRVWPKEKQARLLEELRPMVDAGEWLRDSLGLTK